MSKLTGKQSAGYQLAAAAIALIIMAILILLIAMLISWGLMSGWNLLSVSAGWESIIPINFGTVTGAAIILIFFRWITKYREK